MPNARNRVSVASLTLIDLPAVFVGLRDNAVSLEDYSPIIARSDLSAEAQRAKAEATKQSILSAQMTWIASGACHRARIRATGWPAMKEGSPRRGALHRRLAFRIRRPQLHAGIGIVGVDGKLAAFEQRLHPAIAEFLRRRAATEFCREFHQECRLHRAVEDQARIALDPGDVVAVVMDAVPVECQRRIAKQQHRIGHVAFAVLRGPWRRCRLGRRGRLARRVTSI